MRPSRLLPLSLISMVLGACSLLPQWLGGEPSPAQPSSKSPARVVERPTVPVPRTATAETNGAYRLDSGDRVRIVVAGHDALSNS